MAIDISTSTKSLGIFQSDVIIRSALIAGMRDIRANPWLLEYCFASLAQDDLTKKDYGKSQIDEAKSWFMKNEVKVSLDIQIQPAEFPIVTITLLSSDETETTLADVNYDVEEPMDFEWPVLAGPFTATGYDPVTGTVTLPEGALAGQILLAGSVSLVDRQLHSYVITEFVDDQTITIEPGTQVDLTDASIRGNRPSQRITLEGSWADESYRVGCHTQGEPAFVLYLESIVRFCLFRYRQRLLEARGFESSHVSASEVSKNELFEVENTYSRFLTVSGRIRNFWPKDIWPVMAGLKTQFAVVDGDKVPSTDIPVGDTVEDLVWAGDKDGLG